MNRNQEPPSHLATLYKVGHHQNYGTIGMPNHPPEGADGVCVVVFGSLSGDEGLVALSKNVATIEV